MSHAYPHLFQTLALGKHVARNRIMRLATSTNSGKDGLVTDETIAIHRRIARGGTGIIVSESMRVHPSNAGREFSFVLHQRNLIPSLSKLTDAVHGDGALFIAQLNHGGRQHHSHDHPTLWAPSAVACPHSGGIPHAMNKAEIREVVQGFATAAANAADAGCAGVEIHGAQGHLIQEFLSPFSNKRTDEYGGSLANRLRFASEIVSAVRDRVPAGFIIGYRMGVHEFWPGALDLDDSLEAAQRLNALGAISYFSLAQGNFNTLDYHLPDSHWPAPAFIDLHAQFKPVLNGTPVAASARINTPAAAEAILAQGQADLIGQCRALIADPEWPNKVLHGQLDDVRQCIGCNRCWAGVIEGKPLRCTVNPTIGQEMVKAVHTTKRRKVVVAGGGPGGLEAARSAAEAGHEVVLFEQGQALGGKLLHARHYLPYHESSRALDFLIAQVNKLGVDVRLNTAATVAAIGAEQPDAIVVATGARVVAPPVPGDGSVPVTTWSTQASGQHVVVMDEDGHYWAACIAESLALRGLRVTYVTRFLEPLRELPEVSRISTLRALDKHGVRLFTNTFIDHVAAGGVVLRHYYNTERTERLDDVAEIVWVGDQVANSELADALGAAGHASVHLIGDAFAPRRLINAIHDGYRAARAITSAA